MANADSITIYLNVEGEASKRLNTTAKSLDGLSKEAKKATSESKKLTGSFDEFKSSIPVFAGAIAGIAGLYGIGSIVTSSIAAASALGDLSTNLGVSTTFLQEMQFAANQSGVSTEQFNTSVERFSRSVGEAASGNKTFADTFKKLGVDIKDANGEVRPTEDLFKNVAEQINNVGSNTEKTRILFDLFGRSGIKLASLFAGGSAALDDFSKKANEAGAVVDEKLIYQTKAVGDEFAKVSSIISSRMIVAVGELLPAINALLPSMLSLVNTTSIIATGIATATASVVTSTAAVIEWSRAFSNAPGALKLTTEESVKYNEKAKELYKDMIAGNITAQRRNDLLKEYAESLKAARDAQSTEVFGPAEPVVTKETDDAKAERLKLLNEERYKEFELINQRLQLESEALEADDIFAAHRIANLEIEREAKLAILQKGSVEELKGRALLNKEKVALDKRAADEQKKIDDDIRLHKKAALDNLLSLQTSNSKALRAVGKASAIADTTISTYQGAQNAFTALSGIPFIGPALGIAAAAAAITAGVSRIAAITSVPLATGISNVPPGFENDTFQARLSTGERVVDSGTNEDLKTFLAGGGNRDVLIAILQAVQAPRSTSFQIDGRELIAAIQDNVDSGRLLSA